MKLIDLYIGPNTTLLTPNRRLSAALLKQFYASQCKKNKTSWKSLDILPLQSWLQRLWKEATTKRISAAPLLLSTNQEIILWEEILRQSPENDYLLQLTATAELAKSAWELLKLWQVNINDDSLQLTEDGLVFQQWSLKFQKTCKKNNWIDIHSLPEVVSEHLKNQDITPPQKIIMLGFTEISPVHKNLLTTCQALGTEIIYHTEPLNTMSRVKKIGLTDEETEIRIMARWAKATYDAACDKRPYLIGCVIPRLESLRNSVLQIFSETFAENNTFTLDPTLLPFNISAGKSLASFPIIHTALQLLRLNEEHIPIETISSILRSPFLGEGEMEQLRRAYFESRLRSANVTLISLKKLIAPNEAYSLPAVCPALAKRIKNYLQFFQTFKKNQPISEWIKSFISLLTQLGWPGERSLNSEEYQVTQRWLELLTEYSTFDHILQPVKYVTALNYLAQLSAKTIFQPQTPETPIQILGVLEAVDLPFEHLWVMGFDDSNWPAAPKPNPLIPQRLQKKLQMPHATVERELTFSKQLTSQLKQTATHIIFSYPEKNEDADLRPSSLLNEIEETTLPLLSLAQFETPAQKVFAEQQLELLDDEVAPAITNAEDVRGGTHIFKQQAACPFKAFSELRLHARRLETPTIGLRAIDRGNIVHKALELIWQTVKDSDGLKNLSPIELDNIIHMHAEKAIHNTLAITSDEGFSNQRYLLLELQRLKKLLIDWLKIESQRPDFKVILQEHEINDTIGDIPIKLRVDRIDELSDGTHVIIDYKTGKHNQIKDWFGERPDEPQLPLYCILNEKTASIAFGQVHPDEMGLIGISHRNINIKSIKTLAETNYPKVKLWNLQLEEWKKTLENLGNDFKQGIAHIDPKDINQTCSTCKLQTFCRIHEKI
ncbi:MAG: PD-(D/E)XK nuclease family protein [Gammaproteobacteria bacterium]